MERHISVRAYEMEGLISVRAYKWRGLYLRGPINGVAYICESL